MQKPSHHILVCNSFRMSGTPQGVCAKEGSGPLLQYLQEELDDHNLNDVAVACTSCLKVCDRGPIIVVHPENWWFGRMNSEEAVDAVIQSIEKGTPDPQYLIT
ncbi:MAG: (2Fe-2S) ferredoxin domain-containing protein [Planctomycetaceae bacterium]|jgi:(2Fe-2S) ferredoxin|nr:(2Fe-2S) ferredoxin domain-containing protein [Planctomycetaceae bacterium]